MVEINIDKEINLLRQKLNSTLKDCQLPLSVVELVVRDFSNAISQRAGMVAAIQSGGVDNDNPSK